MRFTNRQILKITFPVLLSLMMEQLIGLTDTIYLGMWARSSWVRRPLRASST